MADLDPGLVEKYRYDYEVIRQTASLVIKDFAATGIKITFSGNEETAYAELNAQVTEAVTQLGRNAPEALHALLYRVDVDEAMVSNLISTLPAGRHAECLSRLILERELTKAVFRKLFSR